MSEAAVVTTGRNVAGHVEVRGISLIPAAERHGQPTGLFTLWFSANLSYLYVLFGGLLIITGLTLMQAITVILVGNLFYGLVGVISTAGPKFGTSTVNVSTFMFGTVGNRVFGALLAWAIAVSFEAINLSIGALAGFALASDTGVHVSTLVQVVVLVVIAATFALGILGHATILRTASVVSGLIGLATVVLFGFVINHANFSYHPAHQLHGLAAAGTVFIGLTLIASGPLTWMCFPAEFARYLPEKTPNKAVILWTALGGYLSSAFLAVIGVLAGTVVNMADPQAAMKGLMPAWFYPLFLLLIIIGTTINNVLGIYSSGLALQALGVKARRSRTVLLDCIVGGSMTMYALFVSNFLTTLNNFLALSEVWLAPYAGVFVAHLTLTRHKTAESGASALDQLSRVRRVNTKGVIALLSGAVGAFLCADTTYWHGPISTALYGADLSPYVGTLLGASIYALGYKMLASRDVKGDNNLETYSRPSLADAT